MLNPVLIQAITSLAIMIAIGLAVIGQVRWRATQEWETLADARLQRITALEAKIMEMQQQIVSLQSEVAELQRINLNLQRQLAKRDRPRQEKLS